MKKVDVGSVYFLRRQEPGTRTSPGPFPGWQDAKLLGDARAGALLRFARGELRTQRVLGDLRAYTRNPARQIFPDEVDWRTGGKIYEFAFEDFFDRRCRRALIAIVEEADALSAQECREIAANALGIALPEGSEGKPLQIGVEPPLGIGTIRILSRRQKLGLASREAVAGIGDREDG